MSRWLLLVLGLAIGVAGLVALARDSKTDPPLDEIDAASRARLERVLEEADRESGSW